MQNISNLNFNRTNRRSKPTPNQLGCK